MPRLYREAPVNSIWEGSGNVMCLDVLRAARQEPQFVAQAIDGLARAHAGESGLRAAADRLLAALALDADGRQAMARMVARDLVLLVQADLLLRHAPQVVSRAFVDSRLGAGGGDAFGARPVVLASDALLRRAWPD